MTRNPAERVHEAAVELGVLPELRALRSEHDAAGLTAALERLKSAAKRRVRELAKEHHPDHGGDLERMQRINAAGDIIRAVKLGVIPPRPTPREPRRSPGAPVDAYGNEFKRERGYAPDMPPVRTRIPLRTVWTGRADQPYETRGGIDVTWDPLDYDGVPEWVT